MKRSASGTVEPAFVAERGSAGAALLLFVVADAPPPLYATADEVI